MLGETPVMTTLASDLHEDRVTPPEAASFALTMRAGTPGGDAYTFAEYRAMLDGTGFAGAALHDLVPSPNRAIVATLGSGRAFPSRDAR
jgi:hypothetical protein